METTTQKEKTTILLNASAYKRSACMRKLFNTVIMGYRKPINNISIEWGSSFHLFKAKFRELGPSGFLEAAEAAKEYFLKTPHYSSYQTKYLENPEYLWSACLAYYTRYLNDDFETVKDDKGKPLIELKTALPYYVDDDVEVIMMGTIDEIGKIKSGVYCVADVKTTSMADVEKFFTNFRMSPQLLFYGWQVMQYAKAFPDSIFNKIVQSGFGYFIDGVFQRGKDKPVELVRSDVKMYSQRDIDEMDYLIKKTTMELVDAVKEYKATGVIPLRFGMLNGACSADFGCEYLPACATDDDITYELVMEQHFTQIPYNPANFGGVE